MHTTSRLALACVGVGALALTATTAAAAGPAWMPGGPVLTRTAQGDIADHGGARREAGDQTATIAQAVKGAPAKNVILIIGDGMADSEITAARNYSVGAGQAFPGIDAFPMTGQMTHYSLTKDGKPDYVPDSAAAGSAFATGTKTYDGGISVNIKGEAQPTLLQQAKAGGKLTGNVTTAEIQDATPAVQMASVSQRYCFGPEATSAKCPENALENGGKGSITEQILDTRPDIVIGGGSMTFAERAKAGRFQGETLQGQAEERKFNYITTKDALMKVDNIWRKPVLAPLTQGNMPVKYRATPATVGGASKDAVTCTPNPEFANVPTLGEMTQKSIELLSQDRKGKENGFFLQVESASIDKTEHGGDACGHIGETEQTDDAARIALDFAKKNPDTLVILTSDHGQQVQIVDGDPGTAPSIKLRTKDGSDMILQYGTAPAGKSGQHTGTQLRVAAYGPGAANVVGLIDNTDLFFIMKGAMRLK